MNCFEALFSGDSFGFFCFGFFSISNFLKFTNSCLRGFGGDFLFEQPLGLFCLSSLFGSNKLSEYLMRLLLPKNLKLKFVNFKKLLTVKKPKQKRLRESQLKNASKHRKPKMKDSD